jgi:hypothetical protein
MNILLNVRGNLGRFFGTMQTKKKGHVGNGNLRGHMTDLDLMGILLKRILKKEGGFI